MDERIYHLQETILNDLQHQWTIEEIAKVLDISAPHLQRVFKSEVGISPIAWLRQKRLEKACELLKTEYWQIQQIGIKVGMPNDSHFTRDFKKKYGATPTEFRKQHHKKLQAERQKQQK